MPDAIRGWLKQVAPGWALSRYREPKGYDRLRRFRRELEGFRSRTVSHTYGGLPLDVWIADPVAEQLQGLLPAATPFRLDVWIADPVAEQWYDRDMPGMAEIDFLRLSKLRPGATVFDIGAHQCVVALLLADAVGPRGKVVAVEAHPHNAAIGRRNRDLNRDRAAGLEVVNAAVGDRPGKALLHETGLNSKVGQVDRVGRIEVDAVTVDDLTARHGRPDVVYIDVEGFECQVLRGAGLALATRPDLMVEVHVGCGLEDFGGSVGSLLSLLPPDGYDLFMSPDARDGVGAEAFEPYRAGDGVTKSRFYLAAIAR